MSDSPSSENMSRSAARAQKRARGRSRAWVSWVIVLVLVLGGAAAAYLLLSRKAGASSRLDDAFSDVEKADRIVVDVDAVIQEEITTQTAGRAEDVVGRIPDAEKLLKSAVTGALDAKPRLGDEDKADADALVAAARARLDMLKQAPLILQLNVKASNALGPGASAWAKVLEADKLNRSAAAEYNKLTKAGVTSSSALNAKALSALTEARTLFDTAEKAFPEAPFEKYLAYVDARSALVKLSQQSDALWLKGDVAGANKVIATYNIADKKTVEQGKALPVSTEQAIADAYDAAASQATEAYTSARKAAMKADSRIR